MPPQISVVVATFHREDSLSELLDSLFTQHTHVAFEIIVADNGSADRTADVVLGFRRRGLSIGYVREPRRGVSYARNTGAAMAQAPIIAFTDDDQHVAPLWIETIASTFQAHPEVTALGGRVLARWDHPRPPWVTPSLLGPVSLFDRGEQPLRLHRRQWMCLPGGNLAIRSSAFASLGGFNPEYARSQDRELTVRLLLSGLEAMYVPDMVVYHHLDADRLTKRRFRAWSASEGRNRAGYAFEELFSRDGEIRPLVATTPRVLGISRFMYRRLGEATAQYLKTQLLGTRSDAFRHEMRLRYLWAYMRRRRTIMAAARKGARLNRVRQGAVRMAARLLAVVSEIVR